MTQPHTHASHPAIIKRLRRASGHLSSTIDMVVQGRDCVDVAQQLQAVESAGLRLLHKPLSPQVLQTELLQALSHQVSPDGHA